MIWQATLTTLSWVENLTELIIEGCDNLEYLFSSSMARGLVKLKYLHLNQCKRMKEVIFEEDEEEKGNLIFPQLINLLMKNLGNLTRFYSGNCIVEFPYLKELRIFNCPEFKGFTPKAVDIDDRNDIHVLFNEQVIKFISYIFACIIMIEFNFWN